jgi:hypothetical protein
MGVFPCLDLLQESWKLEFLYSESLLKYLTAYIYKRKKLDFILGIFSRNPSQYSGYAFMILCNCANLQTSLNIIEIN